jgi:hypothetical protein
LKQASIPDRIGKFRKDPFSFNVLEFILLTKVPLTGNDFKSFVISHAAPLFGTICWLAIVAVEYSSIMKHTHGQFTYALDDAYIHMAMARQLVEHGVWGVTKYNFSATSSSPLWTLILSLLFSFQINEFVPLLLNSILAVILIFIAARLLRQQGASLILQLVTISALIFLTPLPALAFGGQEHILQTILSLLFVFAAAHELSGSTTTGNRLFVLPLLAFASVACRYEAGALVLLVAIMFATGKRFTRSAVVLCAGVAPVVIMAAYSLSQGGLFLPNSVLLKSVETPPLLYGVFFWFIFAVLSSLFFSQRLLHAAGVKPHLQVLVILVIFSLEACALSYGLSSLSDAQHASLSQQPAIRFWVLLALLLRRSFLLNGHFIVVLLCLFAGHCIYQKSNGAVLAFPSVLLRLTFLAALIHFCFGRLGWFYRYEAYLVALSIMALAVAVARIPTEKLAMKTVFGLLIAGCALRGYRALVDVPLAAQNIHDQQFQMSQFIHCYYPYSSIVLNDIGTVCFNNDVAVVDLYGLGNNEIANARLKHLYTTDLAESICNKAASRFAILYDPDFCGLPSLPKSWKQVGSWTLDKNIVCARNRVHFFAIDPTMAAELAAHLRTFRSSLPRSVSSDI